MSADRVASRNSGWRPKIVGWRPKIVGLTGSPNLPSLTHNFGTTAHNFGTTAHNFGTKRKLVNVGHRTKKDGFSYFGGRQLMVRMGTAIKLLLMKQVRIQLLLYPHLTCEGNFWEQA